MSKKVDHSRGFCGVPDVPKDTPFEEARKNINFIPDVIGVSIDFSTSSGHF